jgi:hypothetical protein
VPPNKIYSSQLPGARDLCTVVLFPHGATATSGPGSSRCRGFTITLRHITFGRTPLDEWSAPMHRLLLDNSLNTRKRHPCAVGLRNSILYHCTSATWFAIKNLSDIILNLERRIEFHTVLFKGNIVSCSTLQLLKPRSCLSSGIPSVSPSHIWIG